MNLNITKEVIQISSVLENDLSNNQKNWRPFVICGVVKSDFYCFVLLKKDASEGLESVKRMSTFSAIGIKLPYDMGRNGKKLTVCTILVLDLF